ncbi:HET-domain-containing protein [Lojkania enalia]|uniref:HET-domain-containing protein n=1 Tax=Lojkania enalia TaxID=147567 RepID=A0A9P4MZE3_9PLEO|nr:HET-domain-containing protein [Didymosphaeria enalia]
MFNSSPRVLLTPRNLRYSRIAAQRFATNPPATKSIKWRRTKALINCAKVFGILYAVFYLPNPLRSIIYDPLEEHGILDAITENTIFQIIRQPVVIKDERATLGSVYRPITEPKEIRLIVLEPGRRTDPISCRLIHVPLSWRTRYEALSYSWGDQNNRASVICDGQIISVTANLHSALLDLRYTDRQRVIWADCICINQNDLEEKSAQFQLMGQIYAGARRTIVWLGETSDNVKGALSTLQNVYPWVMLYAPFELLFEVVPLLQPFAPKWISQPHLPESANWNAVNRLLELPWFRRTWIVQEVILSKYAVVVCGQETINFQKLLATVRSLQYITVNHGQRFPIIEVQNETVRATTVGLYMIQKVRENLRSGPWLLGRSRKYTSTLVDMVHETRGFQCSEPKDRIYAIINVTTDESPVRRGLIPDYRLDVGEVYRRFVVWDIQKNHSLSTLSFISDKSNTTFELPSWVPDFSNANHEYFLPDYYFTFNATPRCRPEARISEDGKILTLKGKRIDTVRRVARMEYPGQLSRSKEGILNKEIVKGQRQWLRECFDIAIENHTADNNALIQSFPYWKSQTCGMTNQRFQQFWRTMIWGHNHHGSKASALYGTYFRSYGAFIHANLEDEKVLKEGGVMQLLIEACFTVMLRYRRFCSTENGSIGWVPRGTQEGDEICVLYGGKVPVVLRPRDQGYELIGDAYIYQLMNGEALLMDHIPDDDLSLL